MSETRPKRKVEFIESYWTGGEYGSDYKWNDNHGELVRCKDCRNAAYVAQVGTLPFVKCGGIDHELDWFCADGKRR